jgi:hypothetical protein
MIKDAYKLVRLRADGTVGPLFINRRQVLKLGTWMRSEDHPTAGYAHRPGWHVTEKPVAPHLSLKGRVWVKVQVRGSIKPLKRPASQGGLWWLASQMRICSFD